MNDAQPPIFVTGNPRSGTTLMRVLLSAHPNIYITHEPWFYIWNSLCPANVSGDEFLGFYFQTFSFKWLRMRPQDILSEIPSPLQRSDVHLAFTEIMRQKAVAAGRVRFGEKTPGHTDHLAAIFRDYPEARVILMIRDPRSTVDSTKKMVWGSGTDLGNSIAYELGRKKVEKFLDRVLVVKLEDLRLEPEPEMRRILEFVGEPWDEAVLDHPKHNPWPGDMPPVPWLHTAEGPLVSSEMRLPKMDPERVRMIEMVCSESMKRFGYTKLELTDAPGRLRVPARMLKEAPETTRYLWTVMKRFQKLKDPHNWPSEAQYIKMYRGFNPQWWKDNKDWEIPVAPPWPTEPVTAERSSRAQG